MADYQSMYFELLRATDLAITNIRSANQTAFASSQKDSHKALSFLLSQNRLIADSLHAAELRCEDIFIDTCDSDLMPEADITDRTNTFSADPFGLK